LLEEDGGFEGHRVDAGKIMRKRLVFDEKVGVSEILSKLRKPLRVPSYICVPLFLVRNCFSNPHHAAF